LIIASSDSAAPITEQRACLLAHIAVVNHDPLRVYGLGKTVVNTDTAPWQLRDSEQMIAGNAELLARKHFLIGMTRVRNEAPIFGDTLDFVGRHVDAIIAYDGPPRWFSLAPIRARARHA
jgi:hypothetical protein